MMLCLFLMPAWDSLVFGHSFMLTNSSFQNCIWHS